MPQYNNIKFELEIQDFVAKKIEVTEKGSKKRIRIYMESTKSSKDFQCIACRGKVISKGWRTGIYKDFPLNPDTIQTIHVRRRRFQCKCCKKSFSEPNPMQYEHTNITKNAYSWIYKYVQAGETIRNIQRFSGIHWDTICHVYKDIMKKEIEERKQEEARLNYKPKYLAVDEFAMHKGHTYATTVMDLMDGTIIWAGKGRSKLLFQKFFMETPEDYLSEVKAVAMDMNASYNCLFTKYLPQATIVYDRYHMQSQYGKEVLGSVRLEEARKHKEEALLLNFKRDEETDCEKKKELKIQIKNEKRKYTELKSSRWLLLTNSKRINEKDQTHLTDIMEKHTNLSICYAMKTEMEEMFEIHNPEEAKRRWEKWFEGAKESDIQQLSSFAKRKECRIDGLIAHAEFNINTGKLEGFNNKIKVAKRKGYGYRNDEFFFLMVRYLSFKKYD